MKFSRHVLLGVALVSTVAQTETEIIGAYQYDFVSNQYDDDVSDQYVNNDIKDSDAVVDDAINVPIRDADDAVSVFDCAAISLDIESYNVILTATPPVLRDGENLVITISGVKYPEATYNLGLSCGPKSHDLDFLYWAQFNLTDPSRNSVLFSPLCMMRCSYVVELFIQCHENDFIPLARLQVDMTEAFTVPKQGHIAFTKHVDEMAVMFNSASRETPAVKYGLQSVMLNEYAEGTFTTYTAADMCHDPANVVSQTYFRDPGHMHTVILKGLKPGTRYFYKFGSEKDGWSSIYSFMSRPDPSAKVAKFIAYADMGIMDAALWTAMRVYEDVRDDYDNFLLHFGDISYARGNGFMWEYFFHIIEPYATRVPYMVSIGNHEYDYMVGGANDPSGAMRADGGMNFQPEWGNFANDSSGECSVPMFHRWTAPANGYGIYWYSFDYAGIHVIQISSEHDWRRGSKQYKWLENDLKSVDRKETPWIVFTCHRMMYSTQIGDDEDYIVAQHLRDELEDLLWDYKVNLMLVGHQHSYERSCAVRNGTCSKDGKGPVHIVIGTAGAYLEHQGFSNKLGKWSVSHVGDSGYLRIDSTEDHMNIQFVLDRNGQIYDEVTLTPWK